jgi:hypothetical protein
MYCWVPGLSARMGQVVVLHELPSTRKTEESHMRVREGHSRKCGEVVIPASEIDRLAAETVYLKLDRNSVEALLPVHAQQDCQ